MFQKYPGNFAFQLFIILHNCNSIESQKKEELFSEWCMVPFFSIRSHLFLHFFQSNFYLSPKTSKFSIPSSCIGYSGNWNSLNCSYLLTVLSRTHPGHIWTWINSFMTRVPIIKKPVHWFDLQIVDWFLYDRDLRHERVKWLTEALFRTQSNIQDGVLFEIVNGFQVLTVSTKSFILGVWLDSECVFDYSL